MRPLLCAIHQWIIGCRLDDSRPIGPLTSRHLRDCRQCRHFYAVQSQADQVLRNSQPPPLPRLDRAASQTIIETIRTVAGKRACPNRQTLTSPLRPWLAFGAALGIAAVLFSLLYLANYPSPADPAGREAISSVQQLHREIRSTLHRPELETYPSLQKELDNISRDIVTTAKFLLDYSDLIRQPLTPSEWIRDNSHH